MLSDRMPPTISVEDAAALLGVSRRSAYRAANAGQIPTVRIGRRLLVPSAKLLEILGLSHEHWIHTKAVTAAPPSGYTTPSAWNTDAAVPRTLSEPSSNAGPQQEGTHDVASEEDVLSSR